MKKLLLYSSICCLVTASGLTVNAETLSLVKQQAKTQIAAATAQPQVELLEVGNEPRQELRFRPQANAKQTSTMTLQMDTDVSMAGQTMPKVDLPPITVAIDTVVTKVEPNGNIHFKSSYSNVDVMNSSSLPPQVLEAMRSQMKKMVGTSGSFIIDNRGQIQTAKFASSQKSDANLKQFSEQMSTSFDQMSSPLPQEAIGIGAKWRVTTTPSLLGMSVQQTITYELVNLKDNIATLNIWFEQHANPQKLTLPGIPNGATVTLKSLESKGDGRLMMQLDRPFPLRANLIANSKNEMSIQQAGKAGEAIRNGKFYMRLNLMSK
ncbi:DUF6263 family protein [Chroococcidiopsis thermalis]|uniref:Uncharacterized protein n=1 Tax=Chroococcidiopsis thermalis (strain PCC 7203) TaxID=251229 RepID=K9U1C1_CHRTP|nr:DUF6263 family protein [Chroococcidiopsis thermalis]AFY88882.1 hypothetical protein Chro_3423 [Chroococcidiopsis thermalis PCC 7203]PSB43113.1 hypothetical protein C7B80_25155 [Cyanosarcina cf. burmensis CCALA 770]